MTQGQLRELYGFAIIEDTREQTPLDFSRATDIPTVRQKLDTGDYSATGYESLVTIERKNPEDLVSSVIRDRARFERELKRMKEDGYKLCVIYCEATYADIAAGAYRGGSNPKSVLGSLDAFAARYGVPTIFCSHPVYNIPAALGSAGKPSSHAQAASTAAKWRTASPESSSISSGNRWASGNGTAASGSWRRRTRPKTPPNWTRRPSSDPTMPEIREIPPRHALRAIWGELPHPKTRRALLGAFFGVLRIGPKRRRFDRDAPRVHTHAPARTRTR